MGKVIAISRYFVRGLLVFFLLLSMTEQVFSEGSVNLTASGGYRPYLEYRTDLTMGVLRRTVIRVYARLGETIYLGSSAAGVGQGRIDYTRPDGSTGSCGTSGKIINRTQELAGPLPNSGGYSACTATVGAGQAGVWELYFVSPNQNRSADPPILLASASWGAQTSNDNWVTAWDVTVRNGTTSMPGRAYANYLSLNIGNSIQFAIESKLYIQTPDGYLYWFNPNGIDPFGLFLFMSDSRGPYDTVSGLSLHHSVGMNGASNRYVLPSGVALDSSREGTHKIFFHTPDYANMPASAQISGGSTWLNTQLAALQPVSAFSFTGAGGTPGQGGTSPMGGSFTFQAPAVFNYSLIIDLNHDAVYGNSNDRIISGISQTGSNAVLWNGNDQSGLSAPAGTYNAQITIHAGEAHFPLIDVENNDHGIVIRRLIPSTPVSSQYTVYYDDTGLSGGSPPSPLSALSGIDSSAGAHSYSSNYGNGKVLDTWSYHNAAPSTTQVRLAEADIQINKAHTPAPVSNGGAATYTIIVTNAGPSNVSGIQIDDVFPNELLNVSWTCTIMQGTGTCGSLAGVGDIHSTVDLNNGAVATFTISTTVSALPPSSFSNTVSATLPADVRDPDLTSNTHTDTANVGTSVAIMSALKTAALLIDHDQDFEVSSGDVLRYTVTAHNDGNTNALNVLFSDLIGANTALVVGSVTTSQGSVTTGNNPLDSSVSVNIGSVAPNTTVTLTFDVTIDYDLPDGVTQVTNQGSISGTNFSPASTDDPGTPALNDATITAVHSEPSVDAAKQATLSIDTDEDGDVSPGDTVLYTVTIENATESDATNVTFTDPPVANTTIDCASLTTSQGSFSCSENSGVFANIGTISTHSSVTVQFAVTVDDPLPQGVTQISNQGRVEGSNIPTTLTDDLGTPALNDATVTEVHEEPAIQAFKQASLFTDADQEGYVSPGDTLRYTVTIENATNIDAVNIVFTDTPDAHTSLVVGSVTTNRGSVTTGNAAGDASVSVNVGTIPAQSSAVIVFKTFIPDPLPYGVTNIQNQGTVTGTQFPPVLTDNPSTTAEGDPTSTSVAVFVPLAYGIVLEFPVMFDYCSSSASPGSSPGALPSGYALVHLYEISTCANFAGSITVTIPYIKALARGKDATLRLFHWEDGAWRDVTVSVDTVHGFIVGRVSHLSPFAIAYLSGTQVTPVYTTGANIHAIAFLAVFAVSSGLLLLRRNRKRIS